jgi:predicted phage terminase large subunit-like protein
MFGVMDLAISEKQSADYTALGVFAVTPKGGMCLIDLFRDRIQGPDMPPLVKRTQERWGLNYTIIEAVQFQESLVQQCRRMMLPIKGVRPKGDKVSRAHAAAVRFEAELVFLPKSADWLGILENEMFSFPNAAHDDTVDVISYGCEEVTRYFGSKEAA